LAFPDGKFKNPTGIFFSHREFKKPIGYSLFLSGILKTGWELTNPGGISLFLVGISNSCQVLIEKFHRSPSFFKLPLSNFNLPLSYFNLPLSYLNLPLTFSNLECELINWGTQIFILYAKMKICDYIFQFGQSILQMDDHIIKKSAHEHERIEFYKI